MNKVPKLGIFFSHPTQHHSVMFRYLSQDKDTEVKVYYYDPGALKGMYDPGLDLLPMWDVDLVSGTSTTVLPNLLRGKQISALRQLNPDVLKILVKERFDAVLLFGYVTPSNWLVLAAAKLLRARIFYQSDTNILDEKMRPKTRANRLLRKMFLKYVDTFLVIGDQNRAVYRHFGIPERKLVWCPYPVDIERFKAAQADPALRQKLSVLRDKYDIPESAAVVAFCGKLIPRKRPNDVIEALRLLGRDDTYGLLIGSGPLEQELRASLSQNDRIRITGFMNQSMIPYCMLLADVGVVASEKDAHPLATTEFAMSGIPLVVSHLCGVWGSNDILRPGENGFVYRCGDTGELAMHIRNLLEHDLVRQEMGRRSTQLANEQSADRAARIVADLLKMQSTLSI